MPVNKFAFPRAVAMQPGADQCGAAAERSLPGRSWTTWPRASSRVHPYSCSQPVVQRLITPSKPWMMILAPPRTRAISSRLFSVGDLRLERLGQVRQTPSDVQFGHTACRVECTTMASLSPSSLSPARAASFASLRMTMACRPLAAITPRADSLSWCARPFRWSGRDSPPYRGVSWESRPGAAFAGHRTCVVR